LLDGNDSWVMIHVEIQSQQESNFASRMFAYNCRIQDRYNREVVSLAVLGNERRSWRPDEFTFDRLGCRIRFNFPIVKLIDFEDQINDLESTLNPFSVVVLAHLQALATRRDSDSIGNCV